MEGPCTGYGWIIQNKEVLTDRRYRLVHSPRASSERWSDGEKKKKEATALEFTGLTSVLLQLTVPIVDSHSAALSLSLSFCIMGMVALLQSVNINTREACKSTVAHRTHSRNAELTCTASFWCQGKSKIM